MCVGTYGVSQFNLRIPSGHKRAAHNSTHKQTPKVYIHRILHCHPRWCGPVCPYLSCAPQVWCRERAERLAAAAAAAVACVNRECKSQGLVGNYCVNVECERVVGVYVIGKSSCIQQNLCALCLGFVNKLANITNANSHAYLSRYGG